MFLGGLAHNIQAPLGNLQLVTVICLCNVTHLGCIVIRTVCSSTVRWDTLRITTFGSECTVDMSLGSRVGHLASVSA